jgi:hypothetical protein
MRTHARAVSALSVAVLLPSGTERLGSQTQDHSPMPSDKDKFTTGELSDVIAYLLSLKGS